MEWKLDTSFSGQYIYSIQENITIIIIILKLHNSLRQLTDPSSEIYGIISLQCWHDFQHPPTVKETLHTGKCRLPTQKVGNPMSIGMRMTIDQQQEGRRDQEQ